MIKAGDSTKKEILHMPRIGSVFLKPKVYSSPLISVKKPPDFTFSAVVRFSTMRPQGEHYVNVTLILSITCILCLIDKKAIRMGQLVYHVLLPEAKRNTPSPLPFHAKNCLGLGT